MLPSHSGQSESGMVSDGRSADRAITVSDDEDFPEGREDNRNRKGGNRNRNVGKNKGKDRGKNKGKGAGTSREGVRVSDGGRESDSSVSSGLDLPDELLRASVAELRAICDDGLDAVEDARRKSSNLQGGQSKAIKLGGARTRDAVRALCRRVRAQEGEALAMAEKRNRALMAEKRRVERENEKLRAEIGEIRRDMADLRQELNDRNRTDIRKAVEEEVRKERSKAEEIQKMKDETEKRKKESKVWEEREKKLREEINRERVQERERMRMEMESREKEWKEKERREREKRNREEEDSL